MKKSQSGFTLIELMMAVAIIALLVTLVVPKFGELIVHAKEAKIKGLLGGLRGALTIYIADHGAADITVVLPIPQLVPTYIDKIPVLEVPGHVPTDEIRFGVGPFPMLSVTDWGCWLFLDNDGDYYFTIACMHQDSRGKNYVEY